MKSEIPELRKGFDRRWHNLVERSKIYGVSLPDKEELWGKLLTQYEDGFKCPYCGAIFQEV